MLECVSLEMPSEVSSARFNGPSRGPRTCTIGFGSVFAPTWLRETVEGPKSLPATLVNG